MNEEMVTITKQEYDELLKAQGDANFLYCLQACGVDNWGGYADAQDMYTEQYAE